MRCFNTGRFSLELGKKTYIMGILNVTPDSFSDGGEFFDKNDAIKQAEKMVSEGADIIDIGAVSTRPFADEVSPEEEWQRLRNVIPEIRKRFDIPLSVDTFNPSTAKLCLDEGVDIINDVSGVFSSEMAETIKNSGCGWIMMHGGVALRKADGSALLCALSRKRFIGALTGEKDKTMLDSGTLAANITACLNGADIIRVHNVAIHKNALKLIDALR